MEQCCTAVNKNKSSDMLLAALFVTMKFIHQSYLNAAVVCLKEGYIFLPALKLKYSPAAPFTVIVNLHRQCCFI